MTTSKGMSPALTRSARSSMPTTSAPAALASSALAPWANTATRLVLPVPLGITTAPRTTWSDFLASMPSCTATSMDSSNLAVARLFTRSRASVRAYSLVDSTLPASAFCFLVSLAMSDTLHDDAHRTGGAGDGLDRGVQVGSRQVLGLDLGDLFQLGTGQLADLVQVGALRALLDLGGLLQQHGRRRRLDDEGEALVREGGDDHRQLHARLEAGAGRLGVERLAELHDVQAALTERGTHRRRRICLAGRDLQLDEADYLLGHVFSNPVTPRPAGSPEC
mmetsp:Transcript_23362/g.55502  ORF Transcript_23362/g.55502 Transcript_23362/m.55502 type:complete len:278 (+) Transcript_23362:10383-11216(+)